MAFNSIRTKILINLILVTVLFGLGMIVFTETFINRRLHNMGLEKGVVIAKRIAMDCVTPIITENYFEISMMFNDLMASEQDIVYAYVLDDSGREVVHTFKKGVPRDLILAHEVDLRLPFSTKELATDKGDVHDITVPLLSGQVGVLHLGMSDEAIKKDVNDIKTAIILFSLAVLIVGTLASICFSRTITSPLLNLAGAVEAYGRGDINYYPQVNSKDEIGELTRIFNKMIEQRRLANAEREKLILELQDATGKIKTLSGFLPICAHCKNIRDDNGYWHHVETYIKDHSDAEFSHSICLDCAKKLYPEVLDENGKFRKFKT